VIGRRTALFSVAAGLGLGLLLAAGAPAEACSKPEPMEQRPDHAPAPGQLFLRAWESPPRGLDFDGVEPEEPAGLSRAPLRRQPRAPGPPEAPPESSRPKVRVELLATPPPTL